MPRGCFGGFTKTFQEGTKNTSHWHFIALTLICTFESLAHGCTCWISGKNITVAGSNACYLHDGLIDWCQQACTRFKPQILEYFLCQLNLWDTFAGSSLWASRGTWKSWALDRATLLITKSGAGGCDCVSGQDICTLTEGKSVTIWGQVRLSDSEYQAASG